MKVTKVEIENFMAIGRIDASLEDKGLVLISGENGDDTSQDSNGSGKSSFPDAISWCLFGQTARGETGDPVVNRTAKKNCRVSMTLDDNGDIYEVTRYRKHSSGKNGLSLLVNGVDQTQGTSKLTQERVTSLVGCSVDVFNAAVYAGQERMPDLPGMTDKMLKTIVEEAAGIDRLREASSLAAESLKNIKSDIVATDRKIETRREALESAQALCEKVRKQFEDWSKTQNTIIETMQVEIGKARDEFSRIKEMPTDVLTEQVEKIEREVKKLGDKESERASLRGRIKDAEKNLTIAETELNSLKQDIQKGKKEYKDLANKVGEPCPQCGQPYVGDHLQTVRENAKIALLGKGDEAQKVNKRIHILRKGLEQHTQELADYEAETTTAVDLFKEHKALSQSLEEANKHNQNRSELGFSIATKEAELHNLCCAENPNGELLSDVTLKVKEARIHLEATELEREELERERDIAEAVNKVYGKAGVRAHILDTVTPFLNERTRDYLSVLTDSNIQAVWSTLSEKSDGELRENFSIQVLSKTGAATFKGLSGGERRKVRLACSMALQDLVSSRASKPIELYIADEIDDALDESGLERLMTILDAKAKLKGTVLVVSHNSLSDWIRQEVTIKKSSGKAEMIGSCLL